jgi:hypothetical protein
MVNLAVLGAFWFAAEKARRPLLGGHTRLLATAGLMLKEVEGGRGLRLGGGEVGNPPRRGHGERHRCIQKKAPAGSRPAIAGPGSGPWVSRPRPKPERPFSVSQGAH